ncbi:MAG: TetR/AcrR family transcriptional regulator C-terminal domain-containing protein [Azospirillaceae bacterium]|nr:TetR/AcrR family transcriptional regulator C-terminal domain-containing protein [Azospirillaceae bacterium]
MAGSTFHRARPRGEMRRAQILQAATEVFLENGFGGATIDLVVTRAGASKSSIYSFFGDKEGLFAAIIEDCSRRLMEAFLTIDVTGVGIPNALTQIARRYLEITLAPDVMGIFRLILAEGIRFPAHARTFFRLGPDRNCAHLAGILRTWQRRGLITVDDPEITAAQFLGAVAGELHLRAVAGVPPADLATAIDDNIQNAVRIFGNAIRQPRAPPSPTGVTPGQRHAEAEDTMLTNWKSIAVFLDDTPQGEKVGEYAARLARRCEAHLVGIHAIAGFPGEQPSDGFARGQQAVGAVVARRRAAEEKTALAVGRRFAALSHDNDISTEFRVIWSGRADRDDLLTSLRCDLVVLGHPTPPGLPKNWSADQLLIASGVPVLIIPEVWNAGTVGTRALVAWNASRESRRAIVDALPLLRTAQAVTVLIVDPDKRPGIFGENPGADIALYLAHHDVQAQVQQTTANGYPIADTILAQVAAQNSDLLVIGAYSHSRSSEIIFGGVTRSLLAHAPVPILLSR